jgi:hypothetical protein
MNTVPGALLGSSCAHIRTINSYLTRLHIEGHAPEHLKLKLQRAPLRQHRLLTPADLHALVRYRPKRIGQQRTHTLILTMLDTGS